MLPRMVLRETKFTETTSIREVRLRTNSGTIGAEAVSAKPILLKGKVLVLSAASVL